jgi:hypothetical protein
MLNGRSNVISLATLAQIAQDNEFLLYPMKVKAGQLQELATPYILHSDFHFETITDPMDLLGVPLEDEVYVLTMTPDIGEIVEPEEGRKVRGSKKVMRWILPAVGAIAGSFLLPGLGTVLGSSLGGLAGGIGGGVLGATGIGIGSGLGTALGNSLTGKPNWAGAAISGAGAGLTAGMLGAAGVGGSAASGGGAAGGASGSALGASTAGATGTGAFGAGMPTAAGLGLSGGGAAGLSNIAGSGAAFGTNAATSSLGSSLGAGLSSPISQYTSSMMSKSMPTSAFSPTSIPSTSLIQPTLNSANVGSGTNMLNPMGSASTTSATGATGGSMPSLVPAPMGGGTGGSNILSQFASGAGKALVGGGSSGGMGLGGLASKAMGALGPQGLLGAGMLGYNMLRKSPSIDTSAYDDYLKQMQMMYSQGGSSPYAKMAIPELQRGIGAGVEGIFPSTDSKWYTTQLAQKQAELDTAKTNLGNQYALYGRVNSPEHIKALSDLETSMGQQMDTLKAQMSETNRSQNIGGMQQYLQLAMQGDQNAFAALASAMGSVADAKAAMSAYQAGFEESRLGTIGNLGSTLIANQFNPMNALLARMGSTGFGR